MQRLPSCSSAAIGLFLCLGIVHSGSPARGQDIILDLIPADVTIKIVNGTTGEPAQAQHVLLRETHPTLSTVIEEYDVDGEITFPRQMLINFSRYIATAWVDGVAYHAEERGQYFIDGRALVVHCFTTTEDLDGLAITGMNVVVRQRIDGFGLEYILQVANESRPQHTVAARSLPVQLALPPGLERLKIDVGGGGPDVRRAELQPGDGGRQGIAVALTPGTTRLTISGVLPDVKRAEMTISANLEIAAWSLLVWPADLQVHSFDLEHDRQSEYPEFSRWLGKPLAPGQQVRVTIDQPPHLADLLPEDAPDSTAADPAPAQPVGRPAFPWRTVLAATVLIALYLFWRSRR